MESYGRGEEAKRRKCTVQSLQAAVHEVGTALRKLATAASANLGGDCYLHAELGRLLLADLGIQSRRVVGSMQPGGSAQGTATW